MAPSETGPEADVRESVRETLMDYPIRLGVLFGSRARGTSGTRSDVDIAVEFESSVGDRFEVRLSLIAALTRSLGTDDVDVVDLDHVRPEVGYSALETGVVLVGDRERADRLAERFERQADYPTREERLERFDKVLARLEERV